MPPKVVKKAPVAKATVKPVVKGTAVKGQAKQAPKPGAKKAPVAAKGKTPDKPKEKVWTKEDEAARKIQTEMRRFFAKKSLEKKKKEKQDYEDLMDKLEKEAFLKVVKMQQEEAERQQQKEDEERRQRNEMIKKRKRILEAAFDGDNDDILAVLKEVDELDDKRGVDRDVIGRAVRAKHQLEMVDCVDANENTPLSEAASGGCTDTIQLLLDRGTDVNTVGQFNRTPLYRAAFAGHLEACEVLLQHGADPRLYAVDGQTPDQIASVEPIKMLLADWDISQTEKLLEKIEVVKEKRREEERMKREAQMSNLEGQIEEVQKEYDAIQKSLNNAYCELNKRITEHDLAITEGFQKTDITEQVIHDAEFDLEVTKSKFEAVQSKLSRLKLALREQRLGNREADGEDNAPGIKVNIRELEEVLVRDVGNKIQSSGKWPLLIDPSGQACTFLRYRDTNYLNALSPHQMEHNRVRLSILGSIRYGKPAVLDMMEVDMFETVTDRFNEIEPNLMEMILEKTILQDEKYFCLLRPGDGDEYAKTQFNEARSQNFKFIIITKNRYPPDSLLEKTYPIRIVIPT